MKAGETLAYRTSLRVDLAGGTLDLAPIFYFHLPCYTVNLAIGLDAVAQFKPSADARHPGEWVFRSLDLQVVHRWRVGEPFEAADEAGAGLPARVVSYLLPGHSGEIVTGIGAPKGAGLGGSSALAAALVSLALRLRRVKVNPEDIVRKAQAIETMVIQTPAGWQDYISAVWGGGSIIQFGLDGWKRQAMRASFARLLTRHLLVVYAGEPHFSGANNWALYRAYFEGDATTRRFFERLAENSRQMAEAVRNCDLGGVAEWMNRDWEDRKAVLKEMTTPAIEGIIANTRGAGALSARVCGAGGGGAIAFFAPMERWRSCAEAAAEAGGKVLDTASIGRGLRRILMGTASEAEHKGAKAGRRRK